MDKPQIYIYNSLARKKELFEPINPPNVKMYVCGPTVYDEPHIGHARSAYIFDVIRRYLKYRGYELTFVRNVTDVDDKIIEKAKEEFKGEELKAAVEKVSRKYLDSYHQAMGLLGIDTPDKEPRATEYIPKMIKFIEQLVKNGSAYEAGGDVYFEIKKAKGYGKLSRQNLEKMESGARIMPGEKKKGPLDFALWKAVKEGEPSWKSPWGEGRPGWHIECSVMSSDILGDEFDIHGGGLDLIFPHHENEIAQSEGAGIKFARYWMHHGLLTINAQKMSKSLGNFVTINDFIAKYKNADFLKLFFLSAHYSSPIDYTNEKIEEAEKAWERISILLDKAKESVRVSECQSVNEIGQIEKVKNEFIAAMDDNFNTPQALACLFELVNVANKNIGDKNFITKAKEFLFEMAGVFGLKLEDMVSQGDLSQEIMELIRQRNQARKRGDFKKADTIREDLEARGVILEDAKDGKTTWRRRI